MCSGILVPRGPDKLLRRSDPHRSKVENRREAELYRSDFLPEDGPKDARTYLERESPCLFYSHKQGPP